MSGSRSPFRGADFRGREETTTSIPGPTRFGRVSFARRWFAGAALIALSVGGCGRNEATSFLVPTGIRPQPEIGTASIIGEIRHDPLNFPDLADPPYPPTVVELLLDGVRVAADTLADTTQVFAFRQLHPGSYTVAASARLFHRGTVGPVRVGTSSVDAGNILLTADPLQTAAGIHLFGDFNGFPLDFPDSTRMDQNTLGVWSHPNLDSPAQHLSPGTYRIRFITDFAPDNPTDYGGNENVIFDVPITHAPARLVSGPGTDLRIRITQAGRYGFTLDERRQTFSIQPVTAIAATGSRSQIR